MKPRRLADALYLTLPGRAWAWATYDLANTVFSMNVITMYFAQWIIIDLGFEDISYSIAYSASMLAVAVTMPILGALADAGKNRLRGLLIYTVGCVAFTLAIGNVAALVRPIYWKGVLGLVAFGLANYFYIGGQTYYNALLRTAAPPGREGRVSGLGTALGYVGAIVGLIAVWPFVNGWVPTLAEGRAAAFIPTALILLLLSLPVFVWLKEPREGAERRSPAWGLRKIVSTFKRARERPEVFRFLIGNLFLQDPVATAIVFMAVYANVVFEMPDSAKIPLFIVATTFAVIGAAVAGFVTDRWGPRKTTIVTALGWAGTFVLIAAANHPALFWVGGSLVGIGLGFTWTAARPFLAGLVAEEEQGEFFGLYSLSSRVAATVGPLLWGGIILAAKAWPVGKYRLAVASLAVLEIIAALIFMSVKAPRAPASR
ncbi:MAG: MFS transporter [Candidatus Zixiibacteriota bacterium]|jgi:UMF1 family MFS transporter